ncbi:hypothetical protein Thi970DRAFT_02682 [Thiorhodovibrio frisius]|uniref:Uncharacterized protein n=1 Tax=Thiorhodovibrio frisius TaxID=631362 RepID=H8Z0Z9_9GAMM|nr:hypothetical protein Thi970DRAFT_02682 [Thiorhodovibrio frisius]WPL24720.1 hypothetical protein Thiofri_04940 [Thiorhodovibrio frisius]
MLEGPEKKFQKLRRCENDAGLGDPIDPGALRQEPIRRDTESASNIQPPTGQTIGRGSSIHLAA